MLTKIRPLCIFLPKISAYTRDVNVFLNVCVCLNVCKTKCMPFLIKDKFLEKCNEIWKKISNCIKKLFNRELVHNKKYLKTEVKSYKEESQHKGRLSRYFYISNID